MSCYHFNEMLFFLKFKYAGQIMNETSLLFPVFHHLTPFPVHGCVCANLPPPPHVFVYHWNGKWLHTFICLFFLISFPPYTCSLNLQALPCLPTMYRCSVGRAQGSYRSTGSPPSSLLRAHLMGQTSSATRSALKDRGWVIKWHWGREFTSMWVPYFIHTTIQSYLIQLKHENIHTQMGWQ